MKEPNPINHFYRQYQWGEETVSATVIPDVRPVLEAAADSLKAIEKGVTPKEKIEVNNSRLEGTQVVIPGELTELYSSLVEIHAVAKNIRQ